MNIQRANLQNQQSFKANLIINAPSKMISPEELKFLVSKAKNIGADTDEIFIDLHPEYAIPLKNGLKEHMVRGYHMDAFGAVGDFNFIKHGLSAQSVGIEVLKKPAEFVSEFLDKVVNISNPIKRARLKERLDACKGQLEYFREMYASSMERKQKLLIEVENVSKVALRNLEQSASAQMEAEKIDKELNLE